LLWFSGAPACARGKERIRVGGNGGAASTLGKLPFKREGSVPPAGCLCARIHGNNRGQGRAAGSRSPALPAAQTGGSGGIQSVPGQKNCNKPITNRKYKKKVAEGVGFEPTDLSVSGFQDRRLKPLGHPSFTCHKYSLRPKVLSICRDLAKGGLTGPEKICN
jgi:hypothetical protein